MRFTIDCNPVEKDSVVSMLESHGFYVSIMTIGTRCVITAVSEEEV